MKWLATLLLAACIILVASKFENASSTGFSAAGQLRSASISAVETGNPSPLKNHVRDDWQPEQKLNADDEMTTAVRATRRSYPPETHLLHLENSAENPVTVTSATQIHRTSTFDKNLDDAQTASNAFQPDTSLPISFMLPDEVDPSAQIETDMVHLAQTRFADTMNEVAASSDAGSPEYARQWQAAKASHDDMLRLQLGHEGFFRLSALAAQRVEAAKVASAGRVRSE